MKLKRACLLLLCGAIMIAPTLPGFAEESASSTKKVYVLNKNADLWPEKEAKGTPYKKDLGIQYAVRVINQDGEWTLVETLDGGQGYMHTYYLGGKYMIRLQEHAYIMREKSEDIEKDITKFGTVAFDRGSGEDLIVISEEDGWFYVIELKDGIGGYLPKSTAHQIIEYP